MSKRVLIIDDDLGIRKVTQISLEEIAGWEVLMAASGQDGIVIAQTELLDAILLDVMMPGMDGITTLKHLQTNHVTEAPPIILLTAKAQAFEQQLTDLPVVGTITKPFTAPDLVKQMRVILNWNE